MTDIFITLYVLCVVLGQGHEVHVSLGDQGRGHQVDINTKRAGVHDVSTLIFKLNDFFMKV